MENDGPLEDKWNLHEEYQPMTPSTRFGFGQLPSLCPCGLIDMRLSHHCHLCSLRRSVQAIPLASGNHPRRENGTLRPPQGHPGPIH